MQNNALERLLLPNIGRKSPLVCGVLSFVGGAFFPLLMQTHAKQGTL